MTENKNSLASMKSHAKRLSKASPEEIKALKKAASLASMKSRKNRVANMTPEERLAYNKRNNEAGKKSREKRKAAKLAALKIEEAAYINNEPAFKIAQ